MNVAQLVEVIQALDATDALQCKLTLDGWKQLVPYLSLRFLAEGDTIMQAGEVGEAGEERVLFILGEGQLQVLLNNTVLATLPPGTVVGEGAFFSGQPRSATVRATQPGVAWALSWDRYEKMCIREPALALDLTRGLANVLAIRMREAVLIAHFA